MSRSYHNYPAAIGDRLGLRKRGRPVVYDLKGKSRDWHLLAESGSGDIRVINEMFFEDPYLREPAIESLLVNSQEPVVVDLGANKGYFSLRVLDRAPRSTVFAYEPHPGNFRFLQTNLHLNEAQDRVRAVQAAVVGEEVEDCELIVGSQPFLHTTSLSWAEVNEGSRFGMNSRQSLTVRALSATSAIEGAASLRGTVTLLKVDIEGGEREALESLPSSVWTKIQGVVAEIEHSNWPTEWLEPTLRRHGFRIVSSAPMSGHGSSGDLVMGTPL